METQIYSHKEFIKHVPVPDRPAKIAALEKEGLYYYENDYKCFEGSVSAALMEACENELVLYMLGDYIEACRTIIRADNGPKKLKFRIALTRYLIKSGTRMSGDVWTSLFNGFHNLMIVKYLVWSKTGKHDCVDGFVEGDDGLFASAVPLSATDFESMGHKVEIKQLARPHHGHFCGMEMSTDLTLMKDPRRVFRSYGWTGSFITAGTKVMDELLRNKSIALCYEMPQCPVIGQLGRTGYELTNGCKSRRPLGTNKVLPNDYKGPTCPYNPSPAARAEFESRYNVSIATQLMAEDAIRNLDMQLLAELIPPSSFDCWYFDRHLEYA